jgi:hypothetical protein
LVILLDTMDVGDFFEVPTKITAAVDPSKIAGTSDYTMSHPTSSLHLYIFRAFFNIVAVGQRAYCVICSKVWLMISVESQPNRGRNFCKSGSRLTVVLGVKVCEDLGASKMSVSYAL